MCETINLTHNMVTMKIEQHVGPDRIEKPVSTLALVPKTAAITRVGRQAYTIMLLLAKEQGGGRGDTEMFTAPLNTVIRGFNGNLGASSELKRHLRSMVTHVVEWQSPSPSETMEWGACALLSEVKLTTKNGENWISWAYPPSLRYEMLNPQRFAQIRRSTIAQFRSHAALALYEICARYKDNPSHLTSKQHWQWWLPVLTGKPVPDEIKTEFRFFNRDTIKPAVEEVNEVSELVVIAKEHKIGRSVEFLQFEVRKKNEATIENAPDAVNLAEVVRAQQLGIDSEIAEDLFIRHGALAFANAIKRLDARLSMPGPPILSRHAYLKSLLSGKAIDKPQDLPSQVEEIIRRSDGRQQPAIAPQVNAVELRQERLRESESKRVQIIRTEIAALDETSLSQLLLGLKLHLSKRNMPTSVMQRLENGNWQSALVMGELMRYYWKQSRGTEWMATEDEALLPTVERIEQAKLF